jgi:anti-anti-sigma factor
VVLDLSAVEQIDSLGITLVLGLFKSCQKGGAAFSVEGVSADLMRVFKLFNLTVYFPVTQA